MEVLYILNTLVLGFFLWDVHKDLRAIAQMVKEVAAIASDIHQSTQDLHAKTDVLLQRRPPA